MRDIARVLGSLVLYSAAWATAATADWAANGAPVCTAANVQESPVVVATPGGYTIVVWSDDREGATAFNQVYAQRFDAAGVPQWPGNGVRVSNLAYHHGQPGAVSDQFGGAFIAFSQSPEPTVDRDLFMQHVDVSGALLWGSGVNLGRDPEEVPPALIGDGRSTQLFSPGVIVAWADFAPNAGEGNIYAQHVDADGSVLWTPSGVPVCTVAGSQTRPAMVADGVGTIITSRGAIIAWVDQRNGELGDIYAQRLDASGAPQWGANGRPVCTDPADQSGVAVAFAGIAASAIIGWSDLRSGNYDIYAQIEGTSGAGWTANGVPVSTATGSQFAPEMIADSKGGAIFAWQDSRADAGDVYAQRVNGAGAPLWTPNGVALCAAANQQSNLAMIGDLASGLICAWSDRRAGSAADIFVQRADSSGVPLWSPNGVPVCRAAGVQFEPAMAGNGSGGAIVAWSDDRSGAANRDIYANLVTAGGGVTSVDAGPSAAGLRVLASLPNPTTDATTLRFVLPAPRSITARVFGVDGRAVRTLADDQAFGAGMGTLRWDGRDAAHRRVANGIYLIRIEAGVEAAVHRVAVVR